MKLQRAIGQTSQILNLFASDFSVTTGAGLANIPATTVSYTWFHNTQAAASTGVAVSTASQGTYTSGAWTQISSSLALGWYQFGLPDGALAIGDCVGVHVYVSTGAFNMAPIPIEIELVRDNPLQFTTSKVYLAYTSTSPGNIVQIQTSTAATGGSGILQTSTQALTYNVNVTSWANSTVAATSTGIVDVNLVNIWNKSAVTSNSGILTVSTQSLAGITVSTQALTYNVNVTSWANSSVVATSSGVVDVNLVNIWNKSAVTSGSGTLTVSTQAVDKTGYLVNVTSFSNAITTNANVLQAYGSAIVTSASGQFQVSTQSLTGLVVSTQSLVGIVVSTQSLAGLLVSTQTIDKTGYSLTAAEEAAIAGVVLTSTQAEGYRTSSAVGSLIQLQYEILANLTDFANSGTTRALNSVTSHAVGTLQYQYDSTTPSSITRIV